MPTGISNNEGDSWKLFVYATCEVILNFYGKKRRKENRTLGLNDFEPCTIPTSNTEFNCFAKH